MPVEKFDLLLECLLPYTHPIIYPKCIGSGIQATVKTNELVMTVCRCRHRRRCRHGFHNDIMAYMLQIGGSTIHRVFVSWVVLWR